jgi:hypothetical protein
LQFMHLMNFKNVDDSHSFLIFRIFITPFEGITMADRWRPPDMAVIECPPGETVPAENRLNVPVQNIKKRVRKFAHARKPCRIGRVSIRRNYADLV